jgi:tetratricopeptide (TPR) repeat protein
MPALEGAIALKPRLIKAWTALGWAFWAEDRETEARDLWKLLARVAPDLPLDASIIAQGYIPEDESARAVAYYGECLGLSRENVERQVQQTVLRRAMQGRQITRESLEKMLETNPERNDLRVALAKLLMRQGDYSQALGL